MTQKAIGPTFAAEIAAAGLSGLPFSWDAAGDITFGPALTAPQITAIEAAYAAHDPNAQSLTMQAAAMLAAGIRIVSTGTPALNGTYACDRATTDDDGNILAAINAGLTMPGGVVTRLDTGGVPHAFTADQFKALCQAKINFTFSLNAIVGSNSGILPTLPVTIA